MFTVFYFIVFLATHCILFFVFLHVVRYCMQYSSFFYGVLFFLLIFCHYFSVSVVSFLQLCVSGVSMKKAASATGVGPRSVKKIFCSNFKPLMEGKTMYMETNLKFKNSQDYAQKPQRNCKFMNSASGKIEFKSSRRESKYGGFIKDEYCS
jgi:hypothetical protein